MNTHPQTGPADPPGPASRPEQGRSRYSPAVRIVGCLLGTVWFTSLAMSGGERPAWLRAAYAVTALVFITGAGAIAVAHVRQRRSGDAAR
ncbi:hypothetical protein AB0D46_37340 [Streptomyces sp. NPDC048383]|uniref:hypothetical protein n=1 Tax=Streptomyces sp. NPDC048383 TaxID=3155386 RepID=UPI003437D54D